MTKLTDKDVRVFGTTSANVNIPIKVTSDAASPPKGLVNVANSSGANFYVRNTEYGTFNLPNYYWNIAGILEIPTTVVGDPIGGIPAKVVALGDGTGELTSGGGIAHDAVNVGNPVQIGGHAYSGTPTAVANGDRVRAWFDTSGRLKVDETNSGTISNTLSSISNDTGTLAALALTPTDTITKAIPIGGDATSGAGFTLFQTTKPGDALSASLDYFLCNSPIMGFNGTSFDRVRALANNADSIAGTTLGNLATLGYGYSWDTSGSRWNRVQGDTTGGNWVQGAVASDGVDSGKPVKIGFQARTTNPTAVANADRVNAMGDDVGRQVVVLNQVRDLHATGDITLTTTTAETTLIAAAASTFHDLTNIIVSNISATAVYVDIRDTTGGAIRFTIAVPANDTVVHTFPVPLNQTTVNTNWTAQCSASITSLRVFAQAVKNV